MSIPTYLCSANWQISRPLIFTPQNPTNLLPGKEETVPVLQRTPRPDRHLSLRKSLSSRSATRSSQSSSLSLRYMKPQRKEHIAFITGAQKAVLSSSSVSVQENYSTYLFLWHCRYSRWGRCLPGRRAALWPELGPAEWWWPARSYISPCWWNQHTHTETTG